MDLRHLELIKEAVLILELGIESTFMQNQKEHKFRNIWPWSRWPTIFVLNNTLNSTRGSLLFDDGSGATAYSTNRGGWYPGDEWKGDVARILMYMYVRYKSQCLPLNITMNPATYSSDFPDILLKWNVEDPVSDFERNRNNVVYNIQHNRNPFIDNPYLATVIWGGYLHRTLGQTAFLEAEVAQQQIPALQLHKFKCDRKKLLQVLFLAWTASTDNVELLAMMST